ncbi:hypothetical protein AVEN_186380-1 [Araneus ventricosus]|uniref:Uncharacterized protein n=1 Tax=Araneus ventricosus TaxID=182803 RepID=A0A4Y2NK52_ARAVE|nr:hypothetical protein AVEN_186380-1 [Araneus ventricosus]
MDSSAPFPLFSSLRVVGDMNDRPFISYLSPKGPLMTTRPTAFSPLSEQKPAEIRPTSIKVAWPVTAGCIKTNPTIGACGNVFYLAKLIIVAARVSVFTLIGAELSFFFSVF